MKKAIVYKHNMGWWVVECCETGRRIGSLSDTELEAYKTANSNGYLVC